MEEHRVAASPHVLSRTGGVLYLIIIVLGIFQEAFVRDRVVISGDATTTAANLRSMESLWRLGIASELVLLNCAVALTVVLYVLLRPVGRDLALLAAFFHLVTIAVEGAAALGLVAALFPLGDAEYLTSFGPEQLHAASSLAIRWHSYGFGLALIFFGSFCLATGYLILRSTYLPRVLGVLMQMAGVSYLINSFALLLNPAFASRIFPAILMPAFVGEASLALWLLVRGVNIEQWNRRQAHPLREAEQPQSRHSPLATG